MNRIFTNVFFLFIIFSGSLFAQNFKTIYPGITSHFSYTDITSPGKTFFNSISIDSVVSIATGDELYNFISLEKDSFGSCHFANRSTWIAGRIFQDATGAEYFLNSTGDTVFIFPQAAVNNTWHLFNYANGNYIEATVTNLSSQNFLGISDNVKTIQLNAKNSSGNNIPNIMNGKEIKISENYGFVQTLGFKNFPDDTSTFLLSGLSNPQAGDINLIADSIFNFNVNDEFHYHNHWQFQLQVQDVHYEIRKILSKSFSVNNDTIFYLTDRCWRHENYNNGNLTISSAHDTVLYSFIFSELSFLNKFSFQLKDTSVAGFLSYDNGYLNFYTDTSYVSRLKKVTHNYYYYDNFQQCFTPVIGFGVFPDIIYAPGIGEVYVSDESCVGFFFSCYDSLVYYKKGNEEWGNPLSCSALLSADEISTTSSQIKVFPNPTNGDKIIVTGIFQKPSIELIDVFGKILKAKYFSSGNKIELDLSNLAKGLYFLKIVEGDKIFTTKIIVF